MLSKRINEFVIEGCIKLSGLVVILFVASIFLFLLKDALSLFGVYHIRDFLFGKNWLPISQSAGLRLVHCAAGFAIRYSWRDCYLCPLGCLLGDVHC